MISVVTPTYNSEEYLEECIQSLLAQKFKDFEHIVVDGGSSDGTISILKKYEGQYNLRWISEPDEGMYDAIRKGFRMAQGDIFCWLNSDDMYMPWTFEVIHRLMESNENGRKIQWCVGRDSRFTADGINYITSNKIRVFPKELIRKGWMDGQRLFCLQQESSFWSRELYEAVGGINTKYKLAGDFYLWKAFAEKEDLYSLNTVLAGFRIHPGQKSSDVQKYLNEVGKISNVQRICARLKVYKLVWRILEIKKRKLALSAEKING